MNKKLLACSACLIAALSAPVSASTLGERYVGADVAYADYDFGDGMSYSVLANIPVYVDSTSTWGVDLQGWLGTGSVDVDYIGDDLDQNAATLYAVVHYKLGETLTAFVAPEVGWIDQDFGDLSDDVAFYGSKAGLEFAVDPRLSIMGGAEYVRYEGGDDNWSIFAGANYWMTDEFAIRGTWTYSDDDTEVNTYAASVLYRF